MSGGKGLMRQPMVDVEVERGGFVVLAVADVGKQSQGRSKQQEQ